MMQTKAEIETRLAELRAANEAAPGWGAAVGARLEEIRSLERQLRALEQPAPAVDPSRAIEFAYGMLWHCTLDNRTWNGLAMQAARQALLEQIDRDGQARGITLARTLLESRTIYRTEVPPAPKPLTDR